MSNEPCEICGVVGPHLHLAPNEIIRQRHEDFTSNTPTIFAPTCYVCDQTMEQRGDNLKSFICVTCDRAYRESQKELAEMTISQRACWEQWTASEQREKALEQILEELRSGYKATVEELYALLYATQRAASDEMEKGFKLLNILASIRVSFQELEFAGCTCYSDPEGDCHYCSEKSNIEKLLEEALGPEQGLERCHKCGHLLTEAGPLEGGLCTTCFQKPQ